MQFLPESADEFDPKREVVCESDYDLGLLTEEQIQILEGSSQVERFVDDIINENFARASRKITFLL